jgi:sortase A
VVAVTAVVDLPQAGPATVLRAETVGTESPSAGRPPRVWPKAFGLVLVIVALVTAWTLLYLTVFSGLSEARAQKALYAQLRSELALGIAPTSATSAGAPIALLNAPTAGISDLVIVEDSTAAQLQDGPGHLRSSAFPGQTGISVLMGRSLAYGGPFAGIHSLRPGDTITVTTGQGTFTYRVTDFPRHDGVLQVPDTTTSMMTLVTADSAGFLGSFRSSSALYVDAVLSGTPQLPTVAPPAATSAELPMHGDYTFRTVTSLVLALQLLGLVLGVLAWARRRWSPVLAHILGLPAVIAAVWLASDFAARLLPNLM